MAQSNSGLGSQGPKVAYTIQASMRDMTVIALSFATNGSSNPVASTIKGSGISSVVHSGTGLYTVTLNDYWNNCYAARTCLNLGSVAATIAMLVGKPSLAASLTFQVQLLNSNTGSATDVAAATGNEVHIRLWLSRGVSGV